MSAPTEPKKAKSGLSIIALVVACSTLVLQLAQIVPMLRADAKYTMLTPIDNRPTTGTYVPSGKQVTEKEQREFLTKGEAAVRKWGREHIGKGASHDNVALAYLCLAKSSKAGRYYAGGLVDDDQFYGIGPYGTRRGDPAKTAKAVCASVPSWAK